MSTATTQSTSVTTSPSNPAAAPRLSASPRNSAWWAGLLALGGLPVVGVNADAYTAATLTRVLVVGLLAASVAVLAGWCGLPSLGQTAPYAIGAYTTAILARHGHTSAPLLLLCAAAAGVLLALVTGPLLMRTRGTVYLMLSLAVGELVAVAAGQWSSLTGGTDGMFGIPATTLAGKPLVGDRQVYLYVLVVTAILTAATMLVLRSPAGMLLRAVRDNEPRMRAAGHRTWLYLLAAHLGAAVLGAVGGSLLVSTQQYVSPADAGFDTAALVLLAVTIGGATSIPGAFGGAALIVLTRDWLAGPWPGRAPLLVGALLIAAVYLLPDGLAGLTHRLRDYRRRS